MPSPPPNERRHLQLLENGRRWRAANIEKARENYRRWRRNHPEEAKAADRKWKANNKEKMRAGYLKWRAEHPEAAREKGRRNSRKRSGVINPTGETKGGPCEICHRSFPKLHLDHSHATGIARGWLCNGCNAALGFIEKEGWLNSALSYIGIGKVLNGS